MATTGAPNAYVLNIIELQNTVTTASGLSPFDTLSNEVSQIQQMVNFSEKTIATNAIKAFSSPPIQVTDTMNVTTAGGLTVNGTTVGGGSYTATTPSVWAAPAPTTVQAAIDRLANAIFALNGGVPIS